MTRNTRIVLASRPTGEVKPENFRVETTELPALADGQILTRNLFLSLDPYMRPRMTEMNSYTPPFELGATLTGGAVAEVIDSKNPRYQNGDHIIGMLGWEQHSLSDGRLLRKLDPKAAPLTAHLGILGMPGYTANSSGAFSVFCRLVCTASGPSLRERAPFPPAIVSM